jgi:excisionase family DNA binding protein
MSENLFTTTEVAEAVGMTRQAISWNINQGNFEGAFKSGRKWLIPEQSVVDWITKTNREAEL